MLLSARQTEARSIWSKLRRGGAACAPSSRPKLYRVGRMLEHECISNTIVGGWNELPELENVN